jgi:hypothetical protein
MTPNARRRHIDLVCFGLTISDLLKVVEMRLGRGGRSAWFGSFVCSPIRNSSMLGMRDESTLETDPARKLMRTAKQMLHIAHFRMRYAI